MDEAPEHIVGELAETLSVGVVFTVTVMVLGAAGHPELVPFIVYVVVVTGLTDMLEVTWPLLHE